MQSKIASTIGETGALCVPMIFALSFAEGIKIKFLGAIIKQRPVRLTIFGTPWPGESRKCNSTKMVAPLCNDSEQTGWAAEAHKGTGRQFRGRRPSPLE